MNLFALMRLVRRAQLMKPDDDGSAGGGAIEPPAAPSTPAAPAPSEPSADASSAPPASPAEPKSMQEAISQFLDQPRDAFGRFAPKDANGAPVPPAAATGAQGAAVAPGAAPAAPAAPVVPAVPGQPEDDLQMPEGLTPRAQERFQKLANTVREQTQQLAQREEQLSYVRDTFHQHGIRQEQFEQAASVIGLMNAGDYKGALQVLDEQRRLISLAIGEPLAGVDALADYPDLRAGVDQMQISEQHALEIARSRMQQHQVQQRTQQVQQHQQTQQQTQQAVQNATAAVDNFCKRMMASDLDYAAIEAQLLPELPALLRGVPPAHWQNAVETQYRLLKNAASKFKVAAPAAAPANVLRATGQGSPQQAPKSMHEAMWGTPAPSA